MSDKESRLQCISFSERGLVVLQWAVFSALHLHEPKVGFLEKGLFLTITHMWDSVRGHLFQVFSPSVC